MGGGGSSYLTIYPFNHLTISQLERSDYLSPLLTIFGYILYIKNRAHSSVRLERSPDKRKVSGSNPLGPILFGGVAQLEEHLPCTQEASGSSPLASIFIVGKKKLWVKY